MGALLKLILVFYILSLIFSMFVALVTFVVDIFKWHDKVIKEEIISSKERSFIDGRTGSNSGRGTGDYDNSTTELHDNYNERTDSSIQPLEF